MKRAALLFATIVAAGPAAAAWADDATTTSTYEAPAYQSEGRLSDEVVGLKPSVGVVMFSDTFGSTVSRGVVGLTTDFNLMAPLAKAMGDQTYSAYYAGIDTGVFFSHLGSDSSNFFGANPNTAVTDPGANLLIIPADLKIGWNPGGGNYRIAVHGGGNVIYRSSATTMNLGPGAVGTGTDVWRIYPNAGADLEAGLARNVSLIVRPDVTFTPGQDFFTGTLGLGILLG